MNKPSIEEVHSFAKQILEMTGMHPLTVLVIRNDEITPVTPVINTDEEKVRFAEALRAMAIALGVSDYYIISEGYGRIASNKTEMQYIVDNWDTECPSCYPDSMRTELLITMHCSNIGEKQAIVTTFTKNDDVITFGEDDEHGDADNIGGLFTDLF